MSTYLVVTNQTATSPELMQELVLRVQTEPAAEFVLLVPATPTEYLLAPADGRHQLVAALRAGQALIHLTEAGVPIVGASIGAASPFEAVENEMRNRPGMYDGIIVSTFPVGVSHWLETGLIERLGNRLPSPRNAHRLQTREHRSQGPLARQAHVRVWRLCAPRICFRAWRK